MNTCKQTITFFIILFSCLKIAVSQNIVINEFQADNAHTIIDPTYQLYSDWIELYNPSDAVIDLSGYYLTDDFSEPAKWRIPDNSTIRPQKFFLVWADGLNTDRHTNFKLSADGEQIGLYNSNGLLIDSLSFGPQYEDNSYGRFPDGADQWNFFSDPTPAAANLNPGHSGVLDPPQFSMASGVYTNAINLEIIHATADVQIYYTTDGSVPEQDDFLYNGTINLTNTSVIRAKAFKANWQPSIEVTATYIIGENIDLPIVSVVTEPDNLWSDESGIYVEGTNGIPGYCVSEPRNWNQPWERPAHITYFDKNGILGFEMNAGIQIGGGCTRKYPQKSLAVYARDIYGPSKINYKLFDDKNIYQFNNFVLRNMGQDWYRTLFRDGLMQTIVKGKMNIDWQAYKPGIVFLNGEYWGIHGIREKHNEHYFESNYGLDPDKLDILTGNAVVKNGDADHYNAMIGFIENHDMSQAENYNYVKSQMEIDSYIDYVIAEIFFANIDWPGGNIKYWRPKTANGRWRWLIYDTDLGFGAHGMGQYDDNNLANATSPTSTYYANPSWSTFLLRSLLTNADFKNDFIQRFALHMSSTFNPDRVLHIVDSLKNDLSSQIPRHKIKWEDSMSFGDSWEALVDIIIEFAEKRSDYVYDHINDKFNLSGTTQLTVLNNTPEAGTVYVNTIQIPAEFTGQIFKSVPVNVKVIANAGYRFAGWQGLSQQTDDSIVISVDKADTLYALFEASNNSVYEGLFINEIQALNDNTIVDRYGDNDDWIELYNNSPFTIDIGGIYVTDDLQNPGMYRIDDSSPDTTQILPGEHLILWADGEQGQGILHLPFRLSGSGEQIGLFQFTDGGFIRLDSVLFGIQTADKSYGRYPDGSGTLRTFDQPTPGWANYLATAIQNDAKAINGTFIEQNTPNPFNSTTKITFDLKTAQDVTITLYDILGNEVRTILKGHYPSGSHTIKFNANTLPSGVYFYHFNAGYHQQIRKLLLLR